MAEVPRNRIMRVTELGPTKSRRAAEFPGQLQPVNNFYGDTLTPELQAKIYFANAVYLNLRIPIKIIWQVDRIVAKHVAFLSDRPTTQPPTSVIPLSIRQGSGSTMLQHDGASQVPDDTHTSTSPSHQAASAIPLSWILPTSTSPSQQAVSQVPHDTHTSTSPSHQATSAVPLSWILPTSTSPSQQAASATSLSFILQTSTSPSQQAASVTPLSWILPISTSPSQQSASARHPYNLRNQQAAFVRDPYNLRNHQAPSARHPYNLRNLGGSTMLQHDGASQVPRRLSLILQTSTSPSQQAASATPLSWTLPTSTSHSQQAASATSLSLILPTSTSLSQQAASATPLSWILPTSTSPSQQAASATSFSFILQTSTLPTQQAASATPLSWILSTSTSPVQQAASARQPYNLRNLGRSIMLQHDGASQIPQASDTSLSLIMQTSALPDQQAVYPYMSLDARPVQTMSTLVHSTVTNQGAPVIDPAALRSLLDSLWNSISRSPSDVVPLRTVAQPTHSFSAGAATNEAQSSSYIPHMAQDTSIVQGQIDVSTVHTLPTTAPEGTPINVSEPVNFPPRPSSEIDSDIEALQNQILSREPFSVLREVQLLFDSIVRQFPLPGDPNRMQVPAVSSESMAHFLQAMYAIYPGFTVDDDNNMFFSIPDGEGAVADQLRRLRSLRHEKRR